MNKRRTIPSFRRHEVEEGLKARETFPKDRVGSQIECPASQRHFGQVDVRKSADRQLAADLLQELERKLQ